MKHTNQALGQSEEMFHIMTSRAHLHHKNCDCLHENISQMMECSTQERFVRFQVPTGDESQDYRPLLNNAV
jgi:hypothetical protein